MSTPEARPTASRVGYAVAAAGNVVIAAAIHIWPGWQAVAFLTEATTEVLPLINLSLLASFLANVAYVVFDPPWFKALGGVVTTGLGLAVVVRIFAVRPFDFGEQASTWEPITEVVLIFLMVTLGLAVLAQVVQLIRFLVRGPGADEA